MDTYEQPLTTLDARLSECKQILSQNPDDVAALSAYGEAALLRGRLLEALKSYQRLAALQPDRLEYSLALGNVYLDSGLFGEAYGIVRRVLETAPDNIEGHILLRRLAKANGGISPDTSQSMVATQDFLPEQDVLATERAKLERELTQIDAEIAEYRQTIETSSGDLAIEFSMQMVLVRRTHIEEALDEVAQWEGRYRTIEEERRGADERRRLQEAARLRAEEEARLRAEEEARLRVEEEERARRQAEEVQVAQREEERRRQEAEERKARRGDKQREDAYARLSSQLVPLATTLLKTKGVIAVLVVAGDGMLVHESHSQQVAVKELTNFVVEALQAIDVSSVDLGRWQTWVLEFAKGILVLKRITDGYYLVVLGQSGLNFGVLTWTLEKNRAPLEGALAEAPEVRRGG